MSLQQLSLWNPRARRVVTPKNTSWAWYWQSFTSTAAWNIDTVSFNFGSDGRATLYSYTIPKTALYLLYVLATSIYDFSGVEIYVDGVLKASASRSRIYQYTYYSATWYAAVLAKNQSVVVKLLGYASTTMPFNWARLEVFTMP